MAIYKTEYSPNYTTEGSPVISSEGIVTGINYSNYLSRPTDTTFSPGSSAWEIKAKVITGSPLSNVDEVFINSDTDQRGLRIGIQDHYSL